MKMKEKMTKREREFLEIRDRLKEFNNEEPDKHGNPNPDRKIVRIDYEYIYEIRLMETEDFNVATGMKYIRPLDENEIRGVLSDYAKEAFNINLNRSLTFENMITELTNEVIKLNDEEINYYETAKENYNPDDKLFSTNDLLFTFETILGKTGTNSTMKPNKESIKALDEATININSVRGGNGGGIIEPLTQEEISDIIDPDFMLGC